MRILIGGYPGAGKTTLAKRLGGLITLIHTDAFIPLGWSGASLEVANKMDDPGPWLIEGVAVPRALRKWLARTPGPLAPCDLLIYLNRSYKTLTPGQLSMAKGSDTVLRGIRGDLANRGIPVVFSETLK